MDNELSAIIGSRINTQLAEKNKKQKDLAKELGVTDNTISYFCKGTRIPNTSQIRKIAKFFNCSADYLLGLTDTTTSDKDMRFICEYTGLSEEAITAFSNWHKEISFLRRYAAPGVHDFFRVLNAVISSRLVFDIARNTAFYKEAIIKGTSEYNTLIKHLEDSPSTEDHVNWLAENDTTDIKKELAYNLFLAQDNVITFMRDYAKEDHQALEDKRIQYKELSKQKEEGVQNGNHQKTQ